MKEIVSCENLSFSYKNDIDIIKNFNLKIMEGEAFGLVGESGCGKSTLATLLLKLEKPTSGKIFIDGVDLGSLKKREMKNFYRDVQIVFQDPSSSLDSSMRVGTLIEEPLIIHKIGNKGERIKRVDEVMEIVGLDPEYKKSWPKELSGGLKQRLAIAIALVLNPKFIVLDECVSALDVSIQAQVLNLLVDLQKKLNLTYLFITHDLNVVAYIADKIAVMKDGEIVEIQECKNLFTNPKHPYTKQLLEASMLE